MPPIRLSHSTRAALRVLIVVAIVSLLPVLVLNQPVSGSVDVPGCVVGNVGGTVYQDLDNDGTIDIGEPRVQNVTVTAYDAAGAALDSDTTDVNGIFLMTAIPGGTTAARLEYTNFPAGFLSGPYGPDSVTTVTFLNDINTNPVPNCDVELAINSPSLDCRNTGILATSCYIGGNQDLVTRTEEVLVSFPYLAGGTTLGTIDVPPHGIEAVANQIGTTWGMAYQRASDSLFVGAFMKRHTGFGPLGFDSTGAIYRIETVSNAAPGTVSLFLDLNAAFGTGTAGVNPHPNASTDFFRDNGNNGASFPINQAWDSVGKVGLGDIDISRDQQTLYTINLADRRLYRIPIGNPPVAPLPANIGRYPAVGNLTSLPGLLACGASNNDIRPFAVGTHNGLVYVGMVCTAETSGLASDLRAYVYEFNPASTAFTQVLSFALNYPRGCAAMNPPCDAGDAQADWLPWEPTFSWLPTPFTPGDDQVMYPQPWLTDIEFVGDDMILGFRDRFGDQSGVEQFDTDPAVNTLYTGVSAGDILRACWNGSAWVLENNAGCGATTTAGANNGQGPGNGEYYYQENFPENDETSLGGLAQVPGLPDIVLTVFDPARFDATQIYDAGALWLNNGTGAWTRSYRVFNGSLANPLLFGKAGGLGDLEAVCRLMPLEIGNRVWRDQTDITRDGIQDPTDLAAPESPIAGVTVNLYDSLGALVGTDVTDANGEYYFNASNVPGGIMPFMTYTIRIDNAADYAPLAPLFGLTVTLANQGGNDAIDSDGLISPIDGYPEAVVVTRDYGDNDHTFDFGFSNAPTAVELLYFRVDDVSGRQVDLGWATAIEIDNFGFNLYRAPESDFSRAQWIHFEPSSIGGSGSGATYAYADTVPNDGVYWYWLADVDTQGRETLRGPVSAIVGADVILPYRMYLPVIIRN